MQPTPAGARVLTMAQCHDIHCRLPPSIGIGHCMRVKGSPASEPSLIYVVATMVLGQHDRPGLTSLGTMTRHLSCTRTALSWQCDMIAYNGMMIVHRHRAIPWHVLARLKGSSRGDLPRSRPRRRTRLKGGEARGGLRPLPRRTIRHAGSGSGTQDQTCRTRR